MGALVAIVVGAGKKPVEKTENLPEEFVSVATASELTEKVIAEGAEAAVAGLEQQEAAFDLMLWAEHVVVSSYSKEYEELLQKMNSAGPEAEIQATVHSSQVTVVCVVVDLRPFDQLNEEEVVADQAAALMQGTFVSVSRMLKLEGVIVKVATAEVIE